MGEDVVAGDRLGEIGDGRGDLFGLPAAAALDFLAGADRDTEGIEWQLKGWLSPELAEGVHGVEDVEVLAKSAEQVAGDRASHADGEWLDNASGDHLADEDAGDEL